MTHPDRATTDQRSLADAWTLLLAIRAAFAGAARDVAVTVDGVLVRPDGTWTADRPVDPATVEILDLYLPLCAPLAGAGARPHVVACLGASLDGRIATAGGDSRYVNGTAALVHLHRLRALADVVVVGAGTVAADDPLLTVRHCAGTTRLRAVIDPTGRLPADRRVFTADGPATVVFRADAGASRHGAAEIVVLPISDGMFQPAAILATLSARGARLVLLEGGGVTVSRFVAARAVDRLQLAVAPIIIGSGRPVLVLPEIPSLDCALRPHIRRFTLGDDVLFDCRLGG